MTENSALVRCGNCLTVNRVSAGRISERPLCGNCKNVLDVPSEPVWARTDSFDRAVAYWPETLLVVFTADACLYCKIVEPLLVDMARKKAGKLKIIKVDTETEKYLAQRFKIEKTPTFVVYRNGIEALRVDGSPRDKSELVTWIENLIGYESY